MNAFQKVWFLFDIADRRRSIYLFFAAVIGMLLETLGVGLVIPVLIILTEPNLVGQYPVLTPWGGLIESIEQEELVILGMLTLVTVYFVKTGFLAFLAWLQASFLSSFTINLSQRLFSSYMVQPYPFHLQRNSAQLIRNTITLVNSITGSASQIILLTIELLVLIGVTVMLFLFEPVGALMVIITLGASGLFFYKSTHRHVLKWGKEFQLHEGLRVQYLQEGLNGIKDIKLLGREKNCLQQYYIENKGSAVAKQRESILQGMPRLFMELLAIVALATLVIVMLLQGKPMESLVPILGLFAAAAFRIMPSSTRILNAVQGLRFARPVIDNIYNEISSLNGIGEVRESENFVFNRDLILDNVFFKYSSVNTFALKNICLTIKRGTSVGFVGGSGSGKSTLIDVILGLLPPFSGCLKVDSIDVKNNIRSWQNHIGYVPQSIFLSDDTIRRNVAFGLPSDQIDDELVNKALNAAQLYKFVESLPHKLDTKVGERGVRLSGGQRQRIGIARALYHDPEVLVLDEATSSLDTETEYGVMEAVKALHGNKTIIIVAHRMSTVEHCDQLYRLDNGIVVDNGSPAAMLE